MLQSKPMTINPAETLAKSLKNLLRTNPNWRPDRSTSPAMKRAFGVFSSGGNITTATQAIRAEQQRQGIFDNTLHSPPIRPGVN